MRYRLYVFVVVAMAIATGCSTPNSIEGNTIRHGGREKGEIWKPERTWVMMVGVEVFKNNDTYADMPDPNREDQKFYELLIKRGVPKEQIVFLKDQKATVSNIRKEFTALLKKTKKGDTLFTYYTGHGTVDKRGRGYFVNYDAPGNSNWTNWKDMWAVEEIFASIEKHFKGDTVFAMADCCHSGTLCTQMKNLKTAKAYACMGSSQSTQTAGMYWTFTETLISGFTGRSYLDADANGSVSLRELAAHSREEVAVFMQQETEFATNQAFPEPFTLGAAPKKQHKDVGSYYEVRVNPKKKESWQKAKAVKFEGGTITLLYYVDDEANYKKFKADSEDVRAFSRQCFKMNDIVDVRDGKRWYPGKILAVEKGTGIHKISYGKKKKWKALFFYDDLRIRP